MSEYNATEAHTAQVKYCEENKAPHFAPRGSCWSCHRNIYEAWTRQEKFYLEKESADVTSGITVEQAGKELITGCPHCHRSYCD